MGLKHIKKTTNSRHGKAMGSSKCLIVTESYVKDIENEMNLDNEKL